MAACYRGATDSKAVMQLFEASARQVRKEALQHADHLHSTMQQQLDSKLKVCISSP